jgi:hypothetical protein
MTRDLAGIALPQPGFAECFGSTGGTGGDGGNPSGTTKPSAAVGLAILPSEKLLANGTQAQTIAILGGQQPYHVIPVDPGI